MDKPSIFFVMGVSGCGKTTVGQLLANELKLSFFDGDDFHTASNVEKMSKGEPLNDEDRQGWLKILNELAITNSKNGAVIACSALKKRYRDILRASLEDSVCFIYLQGTFEEIYQRMKERKNHFMPVDLLKSQFKTLEPPVNAVAVSINEQPEKIVSYYFDVAGQIKKHPAFTECFI